MHSLGDQARQHVLRIAEICEFIGDVPEEKYADSVLRFIAALITSDMILTDWEARFWNDMLGRPAPVSQATAEIRVKSEQWHSSPSEVPDFFAFALAYDKKRGTSYAVQLLQCLSGLASCAQAVDDSFSPKEAAFVSDYLSRLYRLLDAPPEVANKATTEIKPNQVSSKPVEKEKLADLLVELNALSGLATVKKDVLALINYVRVRQLRLERSLKVAPLSLHMVFSGNPGTGKTTVARLLSRVYLSMNLLPKGHLIEVDRGDLVAGYVGQTALKVTEVVNKARGGILFIDEAYLLTPPDHSEDFGQEAVGTLVKLMEDHRDDLVVIVAGYTEPMQQFIASNPGLRSRFNKFVLFPDFSPDELYEIFRGLCEKNHYTYEKEFGKLVSKHIADLHAGRSEDFGNARTIRNLYEQVVMSHSNRIAALENPGHDELTTFSPEDLTFIVPGSH